MPTKAAAIGEYQVKGAVIRAHLDHLALVRKLDAVLERMPAEARTALQNPPLPGTWVDAGPLIELARALHEVGGDQAVLETARAVLASHWIASLIPMVQTVLRLVGTSPAAMYARFGDLVATSLRGVAFRFERTGERGGDLTMEHVGSRVLHRGSFLITLPSLELVLRMCGQRGRVELLEVKGPRTGVFRIAW